ncbi:MAG TPA: ShlB/FhaC/HecB family hemolysin secretion/activation protein [Oculatellaceae cyanobacterium]|jgi:hemolysin activation/secretion protein
MNYLLITSLILLIINGITLSVRSQNIPQNQNIIPPTPNPTRTPPPLLSPEQLLEISPTAPTTPEQIQNLPGKIQVNRFDFIGNTPENFSQEKLRQELEGFTDKEITFPQLLQAASQITNLYIREGYITSGAYIPEQTITGGVVKIQIVEGSLQDIRITREVTSSKLLNDRYVRSRLNLATSKPLNINRLQEALQLLQQDPLIAKLSAELSAGTIPGTNLLTVKIFEANPNSINIIADNSRNPSVGSFRRGLEFQRANLLGIGDKLNIAYDNTDGSNAINTSYTIPINPRNGTISFNYSNTGSNIIEPPFNELDIDANSRNYEITLRQPIAQNANQNFTQEIALGLTLARRESDTSVAGVGYPISLGADTQGNTRISALRFFQEWTRSSLQQVFVTRSQFSLGVGALDATINNQDPDSRFLAWRGQFLWLRLLNFQTNQPRVARRFLLRTDVQLANQELVPLEQFTLGGIFSVRGYRQDALFSDNGVFLSGELQLPIYSTNNQQNILQLIPFVDMGTVWNSSSRDAPNTNTLASLGLGLQLQVNENFTARLDYGIPLVNLDSRERTWQEQGLYFSLRYNPF